MGVTIIRTHREKSFTVIPNEIINDTRLQWQELGLLVYLLSKPADWDIRVPILAAERDLKERTIYGILKRFQELGYASFKKHRDGTTEWTITDTPKAREDLGNQEEKPHSKNCCLQNLQTADFADCKKPHGKNCHVIQRTEELQRTDSKKHKETRESASAPHPPTKAAKQRQPKTEKTFLPEGFGISDGVKAWATEKGFDRLQDHLEAFCDKARAKSYEYADWDAAFKNAIRDDWAKLRQEKSPTASYPSNRGSHDRQARSKAPIPPAGTRAIAGGATSYGAAVDEPL